MPEPAVLSDPDGRCEWGPTPGRYEFTATRDDRVGPASVVTTEAARTDHLDPRLP